jgi:Holliday junction resolvasome RuvABC endonuclease subunit
VERVIPRVIGLDLSLTGTGVAHGDDLYGTTATIGTGPAARGDRRLVDIAAQIRWHAEGADLAVVEDLPTHAHAAGILGMVHGVTRHTLILLGVPYALVAPASLKRYATGKGNASKTDMALATYKRARLEFPDDNQCDAWWLRAMGLEHLGRPVVELPETHRAALLPVRWPKKLPYEQLGG